MHAHAAACTAAQLWVGHAMHACEGRLNAAALHLLACWLAGRAQEWTERCVLPPAKNFTYQVRGAHTRANHVCGEGHITRGTEMLGACMAFLNYVLES